eukprot:5827125-Pleurochrysis_carterae.AAC.3
MCALSQEHITFGRRCESATWGALAHADDGGDANAESDVISIVRRSASTNDACKRDPANSDVRERAVLGRPLHRTRAVLVAEMLSHARAGGCELHARTRWQMLHTHTHT